MLTNRRLVLKVALICSLISPFVFLSSYLKPWKSTGMGMIIQELIYPVEYLWNATTGIIVDTWSHYFAISDAAQENTALKSEITQLRTKLLGFEERAHEISRLRGLLGFAQHYESKHMVAEVIGSPRSEPFFTIRISKGEWDGVKTGLPVVTAGGVVGSIIRTGLKFSDVHLLIDPNFNLDVLLQRTRVRGILKGVSGQGCLLKLNRRAEIRIGDTIITSGIVGGFPKGLPIGRVTRISYESDHISQTIRVEPWVDYQAIEEVIILDKNDREMQKIMETVGKAWFKKSLESVKGG